MIDHLRKEGKSWWFGMTGELEIPLSWRSAWLEPRETMVVLLLARRQMARHQVEWLKTRDISLEV